MARRAAILLATALLGCAGGAGDDRVAGTLRPVGKGELRAPQDFASISDDEARAGALFVEASRVFLHARCVNCHPDGDIPHMGMNLALHDMPATRGPDDHGVVGMECTGCHQDRNQELARVPGAPKWALAPRSMAWVGKSPRAICEQLKDEKRNGGKKLEEIVHHTEHDELVAWGWSPGETREPAPGTQAQFGALVRAWMDAGAACPPEEARP